jgi:hypothetical protein
MQEIILYSLRGEEVARVLVPPWKHKPEVYLWGSRVFVLRHEGRYTEADGTYYVLPRTVVEQMGVPYKTVGGKWVQPTPE